MLVTLFTSLFISLSTFSVPVSIESSCVRMEGARVERTSNSNVVELDLDKKSFTVLEFLDESGETIETWPMFEDVDLLKWDFSSYKNSTLYMVLRNAETQACEVVKVR